MLSNQEVGKVIQMICATAEAVGAQITPAAAALIAGDLSRYDMQAVGLALAEVRRTARGRFSAGDVLAALARRDGRPHGDEAWAIALSALDERITVALNDEIRMALAAARPVIDAGDMIAARRSFLMAYERLVADARESAVPAQWEISLGSDKSGRALGIQEAVRLGRLQQERAALYLEQHVETPVSADGNAIAGLITGKIDAVPTERNRERLAELRQSVLQAQADREQREQQDQAAKQEDFERRRDEHMRSVEKLSEMAQKSIKEGEWNGGGR